MAELFYTPIQKIIIMKKQNGSILGALVNKSGATKTFDMAHVSTFPKGSRLNNTLAIPHKNVNKSDDMHLAVCHID